MQHRVGSAAIRARTAQGLRGTEDIATERDLGVDVATEQPRDALLEPGRTITALATVRTQAACGVTRDGSSRGGQRCSLLTS